MEEAYLHFLWKHKLLLQNSFVTTANQEIEIVDFGKYNCNQSGPDFSAGKIRIDTILLCGDIEIHKKSSEWRKHAHHLDEAYNNVILHVVIEDDEPVTIGKSKVLTIELKDMLPVDGYSRYLAANNHQAEIVCSEQLKTIDTIYLESLKSRAILSRMQRKLKLYCNENDTPSELLYRLIAISFGAKVNAQPFEELTRRLPYTSIKNLPQGKRKQAILFSSGIGKLDDRELLHPQWIHTIAEQIGQPVNYAQWKRKGMRPGSFPDVRINQFASLISAFDFNFEFTYLNAQGIIAYIHQLVHAVNRELSVKIATGFINHLIINAFVPFIYYMGDESESIELQEKAFEILTVLPPEQNTITKKWMECTNSVLSAWDTQALLEIYSEFCTKKKCLSCEVGVKLLRP